MSWLSFLWLLAFVSISEAQTLQVAAVQMRSVPNIQSNVAKITNFIRESAGKGAQVVVFPECALSGYFEKAITNLTAEAILEAEAKIATVCRENKVYAIVGSPFREGRKIFNSATVISDEGKVIERYHKIQLAEGWPDEGNHLSVFKIKGIPCSIIICHDERYPELVRLPVLAGARVVFYISHESGLSEEKKIDPYRAQIQARAVENNVFVVQANAPANHDKSGSHGHSRIIAPDGIILEEASVYNEDILILPLDIRKATANNAKNSLKRGPLQGWWKDGMNRVRMVE